MNFNEDELFQHYKKMTRECILDGYALPILIRDYPVPDKFKYTLSELRILNNKVDDSKHKQLGNMIRERRRVELSILRGENKEYESVNEYYTMEVELFLKEYPVYSSILL